MRRGSVHASETLWAAKQISTASKIKRFCITKCLVGGVRREKWLSVVCFEFICSKTLSEFIILTNADDLLVSRIQFRIFQA
jgi:hypothetical protein